jgi:hypothetical protein
MKKHLKVTPNNISYLLLTTLFIVHFAYVASTAVNIPIHDEWDVLWPGIFHPNFDLGWLIMRHNEHRVFLSRLAIWISYVLQGWNVATIQVISFILYGTMVGFLAKFSNKISLGLKLPFSWLPALSCAFLFSPLSWDVHGMAYNIGFHAALFFPVVHDRAGPGKTRELDHDFQYGQPRRLDPEADGHGELLLR